VSTGFVWSTWSPSREWCGATPDEFASLLERLGPVWLQQRRELEGRPGHTRAAGAGRRPALLWVPLMATMTMRRQGLQPPGVAEPIRNVEDLLTDVETHGVEQVAHSGRATAILTSLI
jgi:hypothetical protein